MQRKCQVWILNGFLPFTETLPYASLTWEKNGLYQIISKNCKILKFLCSTQLIQTMRDRDLVRVNHCSESAMNC